MSKEQLVIPKIIKIVSNGNALPQHSVLSYEIDLYFPEHGLAIEVDEKGHENRNIYLEIKRRKAIEKELRCEFIRINTDTEDYHEYVEFGKIYNHVIESTKKSTEESTKESLIDKISKKPLELQF